MTILDVNLLEQMLLDIKKNDENEDFNKLSCFRTNPGSQKWCQAFQI